MSEFCQIIISATSKDEADKISDSLVAQRLVAGSLITKGLAKYWWSDQIVEKEYYNVQAFSITKNKEKVIIEVKKIHRDQCPIIAFLDMDGNKEFLNWIRKSVR